MWKYGWFSSFKSGRKLELWLYRMTFSRTDNETQIRLSSCMKYKGMNFNLSFFFFYLYNMPVKQKKPCLLYFHARKRCCQDLFTGTKPNYCSQHECALWTEKSNGHDSVGKNILPKELKREIKALSILLLKSDMMNLSKKCFYFLWF